MRQPLRISACLLIALIMSAVGMPRMVNAEIPSVPESESLAAITIMADAEYGIHLAHLASAHARDNHRSVSVELMTPENALRAIAEGEPAEIYISSYPEITEQLTQRGLIDVYATTKLGEESLVMVANADWWKSTKPKQWKERVDARHTVVDAMRQLREARLLIGDPSRIASGRIAADMLQKNHWQYALAAKTSYTLATGITLQRAAQPGNVALVYASDIASENELTIIARFSTKTAPPVPVLANIIAGEQMDTARTILTAMKEAWEKQ
jgi:ABC-type molybdate transport system substrate-binding protein